MNNFLPLVSSEKVDWALQAVSSDDRVMGGLPVFRGTRVPIDFVLASVEEGIDFERLKNSYPFLTTQLIEAAMIYAQILPRRGQPRQIEDVPPGWTLISSKIVRSARG